MKRHFTACLGALVLLSACASSVVTEDGAVDAAPQTDARDTATAPETGIDVPVATDVVEPMDVRPRIDVMPRDVTLADIAPFDGAHEGGIMCGATTCTGTQVCCGMAAGGMLSFTCADSCPDASVPIACSGPDNCGGNPCCAQLALGAGGSPLGAVSCTSGPMECVPGFDIATRSGQTRLCNADSDCAPSTALPTCCTLTQGGVSQHVCLNAAIVGFVRGATCP